MQIEELSGENCEFTWTLISTSSCKEVEGAGKPCDVATKRIGLRQSLSSDAHGRNSLLTAMVATCRSQY